MEMIKISFILFAFIVLTVVGGLNTSDGQLNLPQENPNRDTTRSGVERTSIDPNPTNDVFVDDGVSDDTCDFKALIEATGETMVDVVKKTNYKCFYNIGSLHQKQKEVCNDAKVKAIANAFAPGTTPGAAGTYDPKDPSKTPEIDSYLGYLRVCSYLSFHHEVGKLSDETLTKIRSGIEEFLQRPDLESENDDNYRITHSVIRLISNIHEFAGFLEQQSKLFAKVSDVWKFTPQSKYQKIDQSDVVNAIFYNFGASHLVYDKATDFYCKHLEIPQSLSDFMDKHGDLLKTANEYILRNAGGELARFLRYKCIEEKVDTLVEKQLKQYNATSAFKVWMTMVMKANLYSSKSKKYGGGKFRANVDLERKTLPYRKECARTYADTIIIRAQSMTESEANNICTKLKAHESYFHNLVKDNWRPVSPDVNNKIEVVVFNSDRDYKYYANTLFGVNTNNGGIYIEGDPTRAGNIARYFCFKQGNSVWNLEHEFTHYLDGRYDMKGNFNDYNGGRRVWWMEGFAQYAASKNSYPKASQLCRNPVPLSTIFSNTYNSGSERIYDYGYLAARYMFERHRADVDTILRYFRAGQYSAYESWFAGVYTRYDIDFKTWCPK